MSVAFGVLALLLVPFNGALVRHRLAYYPKEARVTTDVEVGTPVVDKRVHAEPAAKTHGGAAVEPPNSDGVVTNSEKSVGDATANPGIGTGLDVKATDLVATGESYAVVDNVMPRPTLFGIMARVRRMEGDTALYKGFFPTFIVNVLIIPTFSRTGLPRLYLSPSPSTVGVLPQCLINALFYSVGLVWVYRAITTRSKLEVFGTSIKDGIQALFTHYERARPWRIWTSGMLSALLANMLLHLLILQPLRGLIEPDQRRQPIDAIFYLRGAATGLLILVSTAVFAPLDVIVTRLAAQRNYGGARVAAVSPETLEVQGDGVDMAKASLPGVENVAVRFRADSDLEPYLGVYDCAKKIIKEEGWGVLYRGWFMTFLGTIF